MRASLSSLFVTLLYNAYSNIPLLPRISLNKIPTQKFHNCNKSDAAPYSVVHYSSRSTW